MAQSESEAESVHSQISESQQFEPEEDDAENLWEVEAITAEKGRMYKVKWVGLDPMTMKPWAQSWVPKKDCTPDLVLLWKAKKKEQERKKSTASKRGRSSTASRKTGRTSTASTVAPKASTSKLPDTRRSTSTVHAPANSEVVTARRGRSSATSTRSTSAATAVVKRKFNPVPEPIEEVEAESEEEVVAAPKANTKGRKRKLAEAESAHNSANVPVDVNINEDGETTTKRVVSRPKKKRKVEVELVTPKVEPQDDEDLRRSLSLSQQIQLQATEESSYQVRKLRSKAVVREEEEEEEEEEEDVHAEEEEEEEEEVRMVEDALSQGINSPPPIEHLPEPQETEDEVDVKMAVDVKGKGRAVTDFADGSQVDELMDEDSILISTKASNNKPKKTSARAKSSAKTSTSVAPTSKAKAKAKANPTTKDNSAPPPKFGPPSRKSLANSTAGSSKLSAPPSSKANAKPLPAQKPARPPPPRMTTVPYRRPDPRSDSDSDSNSKKESVDVPPSDEDSDDPPPLLYPPVSSQPQQQLPTEEPSPFWLGRPERNLSPAAQERLRRFDEEVLNAPDDEDHELELSARALERLRRFDEEIATQQEPVEEPPPKKPGRPKKHTGPVQALLEIPSTSHNQTPPGDLAQPSAYPDEPVASSSKTAHEPLAMRGDETENEKDEEMLEQRMFVPNMSSALMMASSSKQVEIPKAHKSTAAAVDGDVETRSTSSKASKKTTTSKSKLTSSSSVGTATSNANLRQRTSKPSSHSYDNDVIPETEPEDSQSQSQPLDLDLPAPAPTTYSTLLHPPPPSTPGGRSTIRSKMRPRTPLSRASSVAGAGPASKSLRPIPMLTPSTFHPHLPLPEPLSSLPESISDVADSARHPSSKISTQEDVDAPVDSIEDFDSPAKPSKPSGPRMKFVVGKERQKESAEDIWNSDSVKRGHEIAEAAKRRAAEAQTNNPARLKKTLDEIRASRSRSASNVSNSNAQRAVRQVQETIVEEEDEEMQDLSTATVPPASGPRAALEDDSATLREIEDAYVDLSGGADDNAHSANLPSHIALRQEEEESTQDVMQGIQGRQMEDVQFETAKSSSENAVARLVLGSEGSNDGSESIPKIVVQDASRPASPRPYSEDGSQLGVMRTTRSRSRSQTPGVVNQANKGKSKGKKTALDVGSKKSSRAGSVAPSRQASLSPNDNNDAEIHNRLNAALALVDTKSQDLTRLEAELASQQAKNDEELERTKSSFRDTLDMMSDRMTKDKEVWEQRIADTDAKNSQLLEEKKEWEAERARLVAQAQAATQSKVTADNEREFFREQYAKASGFVSSVRDENKELEKRIKIAEDQAQSGVALIKATFELCVKNLESDVKSWRKIAEFLVEKDKRTDNDNIRRRAAEHPELASRCDRQERTLKMLEARVDELEEDVEEKERGWLADKAELDQWKKETTRLHVELNEAMTKLDRIGRTSDDDQSGDADRSGNEFVYCCQWKTYDGFESTSCREVFSTISGLEQHLLSGGHLHHT